MEETLNTNTQDEKMENVTNPLLDLSDVKLKNTLCPHGITPDAWDFTADELRGFVKGERLLNVSIDLSKFCNLNCPFCFTAGERAKEHKDTLSFDDYKEMILKLKEAGTRTITIVGEGEPTMYPQLESLLRFISDNGMKICLSTNGSIIARNDKLLNLLEELNVTICLKLNSFNEKIQDSLVGKKGYTNLRDIALKKLIDRGFNKGIPTRLSVNTILVKGIYEEFPKIFKYCRENNIALISSLYIPDGRTEDGNFHGENAIKDGTSEDLFQPLTKEQIKNLMDMIDKYDKEHGITHSKNPAYISRMACTQVLQIDNKGIPYICPARKKFDENGNIIDGKISLKNIRTLSAQELIYLLKESGVLRRYTGRCLFKSPDNNFAA